MRIARLSDHIGAEVSGVDIASPIDGGTFSLLREAFHRHSVLVFRGQQITDEQQVAFSVGFGPLEMTIPSDPIGDGGPIGVIRNVDDRGAVIPSRRQAHAVPEGKLPVALRRLLPQGAAAGIPAVGQGGAARRRRDRVRQPAGGLGEPAGRAQGPHRGPGGRAQHRLVAAADRPRPDGRPVSQGHAAGAASAGAHHSRERLEGPARRLLRHPHRRLAGGGRPRPAGGAARMGDAAALRVPPRVAAARPGHVGQRQLPASRPALGRPPSPRHAPNHPWQCDDPCPAGPTEGPGTPGPISVPPPSTHPARRRSPRRPLPVARRRSTDLRPAPGAPASP